NLREFADQVPIGKPNIEAADPFHLVIEGKLTLSEKGKIIDLIEKHKIGIEKKDLEFQLDSGRVLIPRISEYAGVLIVQALRSSQAVLKLSPVSEESNDISSVVRSSAKKATPEIQYVADELDHPAENIPITQNSSLPGFIPYEFIDQMIVTATIKTSVVEATRSAEYQEVLEALTREMKYRAYRKGAQAILDFEISLTPLSSPDSYKLTLIGLAIRAPRKKK
ncbi:MAG: hypothetical protein HY843_06475, partial [Bdellovibrio sp.]|nr:hypothetical protein [Bdellovibrio sp.]